MCKKNQIWLRVGLKNEAIIWFVNSVQFTLIADWLEDINWLFGFKKMQYYGINYTQEGPKFTSMLRNFKAYTKLVRKRTQAIPSFECILHR